MKIASVDPGISKFSGEIADVTWYPDGVFGGRSYGSTTVRWGDPGSYTRIAGGNGKDMTFFGDIKGFNGQLLAHEMGHSLLGIWDGYERQRDLGRAEGFGPTIDYDTTLMNTYNSIMRDAGPPVCRDASTHDPYLVSNVEVECFDNLGCQLAAPMATPLPYCPDTAPFKSEILAASQFDSDFAGDGQPYDGPRAGNVLNLQLGFRMDFPVDPVQAATDWSNFTHADFASIFADEKIVREYVDGVGFLDTGTEPLDVNGDYLGSSHEVHFFFVHMDDTYPYDVWRIYAMMDDRHVHGDFAQPETYSLLSWYNGTDYEDYVDLTFNQNGLTSGGSVSWTGSDDAQHPGQCFQVEDVFGQAFDYVTTGRSTGDPVELVIPALDKDGTLFDTAEHRVEVALRPSSGYSTLVSCAFTVPGPPDPPPPPAKFPLLEQSQRWEWDFSPPRWYGFGFWGELTGTDLAPQLGACGGGTSCGDGGYPVLWNSQRQRWDGSRQTQRVADLVAKREADELGGNWGDSDSVKFGEIANLDLLRWGVGNPKKGADWDLLEYRMASRHGIDLSWAKPGGGASPLPDWDTPANCADAGSGVVFTGDDGFSEYDTIMVVLDRSHSMEETIDPDQGTFDSKINWARKGLTAWLENVTDEPVRIGVRPFAGTSELLPEFPARIVSGASDPANDELNIDEAIKLVNDIGVDDWTAVGDAVSLAVDDLVNDTESAKGAIFLLTDGRSNRALIRDCPGAFAYAGEEGIPIFWAPLGDDAWGEASGCDPNVFEDDSNNRMLEVDDPRKLPAAMLEAYTYFRASALSSPGPQESEVGHLLPGIPQQETFTYDISPDTDRFIIQIANNSDDPLGWEPMFELDGPNAELVTEQSSEWSLQNTKHVGEIIIDVPSAGEWVLTMDGGSITKGVSEKAIIMTMAEHEGPRCDVSVPDRFLDTAEQTEFDVVAAFQRLPILGDVTYSATLVRPDGTETTLSLTPTEQGAKGNITENETIGNGIYRIKATCEVGDHAYYATTESGSGPEDSSDSPPEFTKHGQRLFVVDTDRYLIPTLSSDCDDDGFTDGEEGVANPGNPYLDGAAMVDTDGDGHPDACDPDSDSDELADAFEFDGDSDYDGIDDRLDVDSDNDGDMDGYDRDPRSSTQDRAIVKADFDGDGMQDSAVGDYTYNSYEGVVRVSYGGDPNYGTSLLNRDTGSLLGSDQAGDWFGRALAAGDLDDDGYDDLVVGVPGDDVGGHSNAGSIHVIYGSAAGLVTTGGDQLLHQDSPGLLGVVENYDYYGERLAIGDFNCDGRDDLVVGVPREGVSQTDTGVIAVIYGSLSGLSTTDAQWYQGTSGVDGVAESYDKFGEVLKIGDFDGNGCADLAVGVPFEDLNSTSNAGYVYTMVGGVAGLDPANGDFGFFQSTLGIPGTAEAGDKLGQRFWVGDFDGDGFEDLATFVPGDGCGTNTKGFLVTYGSASGITASGSALSCDTAFQELDI